METLRESLLLLRSWKKMQNRRSVLQKLAPLEEGMEVKNRRKNGKTILVLGGDGDDNNGDEILVLKENKWIKLPLKLPKCFSYGGAVYLDGEIYIFGGWKMEKRLYKLDKKTLKWRRLADMNEGRNSISNSCLEWNGSIWVFGGYNGSYLKSVERYDPKEDKWIKMPDMKYPRDDAAAAVHSGKFIVCGGWNDGRNQLKSVECFDPESGVWTEWNDLPSPRHGPSLVSYNNSLILMGGEDDGSEDLNSVLELNNLRGTWKRLPPMKSSHRSFSSALLNNEIFVIGRRDQKEVEIFDGQNWRDGPLLPYFCYYTPSIVIPQNLADVL